MAQHSARRATAANPTRTVTAAAAVAVGAVIVSAGVYASWNTSGALSTGTYSGASIASSFASTGTPVFSASLSNMVPGDSATRYADLQNQSSVALAFTLTTSGSGTLANAFDIAVYRCTTAWESGECGGDAGTVVTSGTAVAQSNLALGNLPASGHLYLKLVIELPDDADQETYAGQSGTVTLTETGTTLAGAAR